MSDDNDHKPAPVSFNIPPSLVTALDNEARRQGQCSRSALVRRLLGEALATASRTVSR